MSPQHCAPCGWWPPRMRDSHLMCQHRRLNSHFAAELLLREPAPSALGPPYPGRRRPPVKPSARRAGAHDEELSLDGADNPALPAHMHTPGGPAPPHGTHKPCREQLTGSKHRAVPSGVKRKREKRKDFTENKKAPFSLLYF